MIVALDDDDTVPTSNAEVLREIVTALSPSPPRVVDWGAATSPGNRRRSNEDAWGHADGVFVVADGMGGRGGGALAARTATDQFLSRSRSPTQDWRRVVTDVDDDVARAGAERGFDRLGTTLLAAVAGGPLVTLVHLGDCRAYRLTKPGDLDVLTRDHNVRSELLAAGLDVREYRERGVALHGLTSFIGLRHDVLRADVLAVPVRAGDRLLLCTDGIHRQLDDDRLRLAMAAATCRVAADRLVTDADQAGGRDNATAVVFEIGATLVRPAEDDRRP